VRLHKIFAALKKTMKHMMHTSAFLRSILFEEVIFNCFACKIINAKVRVGMPCLKQNAMLATVKLKK
jgi:hypothetical protein